MRQKQPRLCTQAPLRLMVGKQSLAPPSKEATELSQKKDHELTSEITLWTPNFNTEAPREGKKQGCLWESRM